MANNKKHVDLAERLQTMLLEDFEQMLEDGDMSSTDRATLARLLMANGWNFDPSLLPEGIRDKLENESPDFEDDPVTDAELWGE